MSTSTTQTLNAIASLMNGREWDSDTTERIAQLLLAAGYALAEPGEPPAKQRQWFTVFVQEADGSGTTHVSAHQCHDVQQAMRAGLADTSNAWGEHDYPEDKLRILGVVEGNVSVLEWSDYGIDAPIEVDPEPADE